MQVKRCHSLRVFQKLDQFKVIESNIRIEFNDYFADDLLEWLLQQLTLHRPAREDLVRNDVVQLNEKHKVTGQQMQIISQFFEIIFLFHFALLFSFPMKIFPEMIRNILTIRDRRIAAAKALKAWAYFVDLTGTSFARGVDQTERIQSVSVLEFYSVGMGKYRNRQVVDWVKFSHNQTL